MKNSKDGDYSNAPPCPFCFSKAQPEAPKRQFVAVASAEESLALSSLQEAVGSYYVTP